MSLTPQGKTYRLGMLYMKIYQLNQWYLSNDQVGMGSYQLRLKLPLDNSYLLCML